MPKRAATVAAPGVPLTAPIWTQARHVGFLLIVALSVAWAWQPLTTVIDRSLNRAEYEHYSHIILLPVFSAYLVWHNRQAVFARVRAGFALGLPLTALGVVLIGLASATDAGLSLAMLGLVLASAGAFALCYGSGALRAAAFPFFLLFFMVPVPAAVLEGIIAFLQRASTEVSAVFFTLIGMPVFRHDVFFFDLPGLSIHVAPECSGIRSSVALLISGLVMANLFLRSTWSRAALVAAIVPVAVVKNGVRIVLLSYLGVYVDPAFITGSALHSRGGIPFFIVSLAVLGAVTWLLRRYEK